MRRKDLQPPSVFRSRPLGFSQGVLVEGGKSLLFISGQLAADGKGEFLGGTFGEQCRMAFAGIGAVLREAGASKKNVVKVTAYVTDMAANISEFTEIAKRFFDGRYPASSLVEVKGLAFPGQVVEVEAIAIL
jgi:2-iminobutanoate/2-iminopropanoate deaminase